MDKYTRWELVLLWWGIGKHIGRALPINRYGHLLNHIHSLDNSTPLHSCYTMHFSYHALQSVQPTSSLCIVAGQRGSTWLISTVFVTCRD